LAMSASSGNTSREVEAYITLGRLLGKEREDDAWEAIDQIVSSSLSVQEKIQAIQELDAKSAKEPAKENKESQRTIPFKYRLPALFDILKKPFTRISYFSYLFGDYRRTLAFGKVNRILDPVLFPPDVKLNPEVPVFLTNYPKPWATDLSKTLEIVLEDSWHYLQKIEYNLLVVLKQLCDKIASINFSLFNYKDRNLLNKLKSLETLFLVLHYHPYYYELLLNSLKQVTNKDMRLRDQYEGIINLVNNLLQSDCSVPSLYNFLVGLNMLKYRRFLTLDDLVYKDLGELINTKEFACTPDIKKKISDTIIEGRRRLSMLHETQQKTKKLKASLCFDQSGEVSFDQLQHFYDQVDILDEARSFQTDQQNIMALVPHLFNIFDRTFYPLLNGHVQLADVGKVTLFTHDFFQLDFLRIRQVAEKLGGLASGYDSFPRDRFLELQYSSKGMSSVEADIIKNINEGMDIISEIGTKVETIIITRRDTPSETSGPLDPMILRGKNFSLPHENRMIFSSAILDGKSVLEALSYVVSIYLTIAVFLHYPTIYDLLQGETQVSKDLRSELEILNRLAGPGTTQEVATGQQESAESSPTE
jgi:hypothetical protein